MNSISDRVLRLRDEKKFSRKDLAELAEVSQPTIYNIENGKTDNITLSVGKKIAKALDIPFGELFEIEGPAAAGSVDESLLNEKNGEIEGLKKQIEQKDYLINKLRKDIEKLQADEVYGVIDSLWSLLTYNELEIRKSETEVEKDEIKARCAKFLNQLKKEIEYALQNELITIDVTMNILFTSQHFAEFIQYDSKTKADFIKNCTNYINVFLPVKQEDIEQYIETRIITKWDPDERKKQYVPQIKSLLEKIDYVKSSR